MALDTPVIETRMKEARAFPPPEAFRAHAKVTDDSLHREAEADLEGFWARRADQYLTWFRPYNKVLDWQLPFAKWFVGGELNASYNCLDRHVAAGRGDRIAFHFEGDRGDSRAITYSELLAEVCRLANALKELGVRRGDRVGIYLGMIPELPVALLACSRIGAPHTVIFGGFAADAVADRLNDAGAKVLITADEGLRRGKPVPLKTNADDALRNCAAVEKVVVVRHTGNQVRMEAGRDYWYGELLAQQRDTCEPERMESEDLLFTLYTSGTTAKPKGIKHTTAGYLLHGMFTHDIVFDLQPDSVYWCTADIGWVTGHTYVVYGPLGNGCTSVLFEGTPDYPEKDRFWSIIEKYGVTVLYTAPTAIRTFMKWGAEHPRTHDLSSLRLLGSVGEPINPEAWMWYRDHIGAGGRPLSTPGGRRRRVAS